MSRDRDPFERALEVIRHKLRAGEGLQGQPVAINLLAQALGMSQTPVREALAWLAGEDLVRRTHAGYVGRRWEAGGLADHYRLNLVLAMAALSAVPRIAAPFSRGLNLPSLATAVADPHALIETVVGGPGGHTLRAALRRAREPLFPFLTAEALVLGDVEAQLADLAAAQGDHAGLKPLVREFYRQRIRAADAILDATLERLRI